MPGLSSSWLRWGFIFASLFLATHWQEVTSSTWNVDDWSIPAILLILHKVKVNHIAYRSEGNEAEVRAGLPPCRAYPPPGAIVPYQGRWLVCLEPNPAPAPERR